MGRPVLYEAGIGIGPAVGGCVHVGRDGGAGLHGGGGPWDCDCGRLSRVEAGDEDD